MHLITSDSTSCNPTASVTVQRESESVENVIVMSKGKKKSTLETESIGCTRRKVIFVSIKKESQENNDIFNIDPC